MTALGLKARTQPGKSARETVCPHSRTSQWIASTIRIECEPDRPPRLSRQDLKDPERFHQRLVEWLLKQR